VASPVEYCSLRSMIRRGAGTAGFLSILSLMALATSSEAQTFKTLFSLDSASGTYSVAGLAIGPDGNLYGTAQQGGAHNLGTVFKTDSAGKFTVLYSFTGTDGAYPSAGLTFDSDGNVYGTTMLGGSANRGTVFKVGAKSEIYSFGSKHGDGAYPIAGVVVDGAGNVYGTTQQGGAHGFGTIFKLSAAGKETILYSFKGVPDGEYPCAGLTLDSKGDLYGTTQLGGPISQNDGTVFELTSAGKETVLYSFTDANGDGAYPIGGVVRDDAGNLYGTTSDGGQFGIGIVFEVDKTGKETVLYPFGQNSGDGLYPFAGLVRDAKGNLYGTTEFAANGPGAVFEVTPSGDETLLHTFAGSDGADPLAALVQDTKGNLYGTTTEGGAHNKGVVFQLVP
jgi:uncharacterized repeat protein (TIGR03803 family)